LKNEKKGSSTNKLRSRKPTKIKNQQQTEPRKPTSDPRKDEKWSFLFFIFFFYIYVFSKTLRLESREVFLLKNKEERNGIFEKMQLIPLSEWRNFRLYIDKGEKIILMGVSP